MSSYKGRNPDGTLYTGEAIIKHENDRYEVIWKIAGKQTFYGSGTLRNNVLNIDWSGGLVSYIVQQDGTLQGSWAVTAHGVGLAAAQDVKIHALVAFPATSADVVNS